MYHSTYLVDGLRFGFKGTKRCKINQLMQPQSQNRKNNNNSVEWIIKDIIGNLFDKILCIKKFK